MSPAARLALGDVAGTCVRQWLRIAEAVEALPDQALAIVTRLPGWRLLDLVTHMGQCVTDVSLALAKPPPPTASIDAIDYLLTISHPHGPPSKPERISANSVKAFLHTAVDNLAGALEKADLDRLVAIDSGGMRLDDFLATRCVEGVVHGLDLAACQIGADLVPEPAALKLAAKALLLTLAAKAPGKAVEVRVPPVAAVQCVEGPRHTRGTPPNVVETDPLTWIELAAGRLPWQEPADDGRLRASGERSDLRWLLPLI